LDQDVGILSESSASAIKVKKQPSFHSPPKNTLRDYQEMISDDEDGINSRAYRLQKNSKKYHKHQNKQCEESDCPKAYHGVTFVDFSKKPNSDLSDYNNF
jgi:hypothetical protein